VGSLWSAVRQKILECDSRFVVVVVAIVVLLAIITRFLVLRSSRLKHLKAVVAENRVLRRDSELMTLVAQTSELVTRDLLYLATSRSANPRANVGPRLAYAGGDDRTRDVKIGRLPDQGHPVRPARSRRRPSPDHQLQPERRRRGEVVAPCTGQPGWEFADARDSPVLRRYQQGPAIRQAPEDPAQVSLSGLRASGARRSSRSRPKRGREAGQGILGVGPQASGGRSRAGWAHRAGRKRLVWVERHRLD